MTTPLTRRELDPMKCGTPGCDCAGPLILSARCHLKKGLLVEYDWTTGLLTIACVVCRRPVCAIAVAAADDPSGSPVGWGDPSVRT